MNTRIIPALLGALLFSGVAEAAPSIYPVDTARFLGGSRFDFKVEFDGELAEKDAKVLTYSPLRRSGRKRRIPDACKVRTRSRCRRTLSAARLMRRWFTIRWPPPGMARSSDLMAAT